MKSALELALKKQLLLLDSASQRDDLARYGTGLQPLFHAGDLVRDGARWVGRHPEVVAGGVALVAALRPAARRFLWRWGKRAFIGWQLLRDSDFWPAPPSGSSGRLNRR